MGASPGTGQITVNDNGSITVNSTVANNQLVNGNIILGTTSTTGVGYSAINNSGTTGQLLMIAGSVRSNQNHGTRTKTLTVGGSGNGLISGIISGDGTGNGSNETAVVALTKSGTGTWTLSGANTYTGNTTVSGGKLTVSSSGLVNFTVGVTIGAGEFNYNSATALSQPVTFNLTGGALSWAPIPEPISALARIQLGAGLLRRKRSQRQLV